MSYVQSASGITNALAFSSDNTAGNLIVVVVVGQSVGTFNGVSSITDSNGNTYNTVRNDTVDVNFNGTNFYSGTLFYAFNVVAGPNTVSVTMNDSSTPEIGIAEYSGIVPSSPFDQVISSGQLSGSTAIDTGNITTPRDSELLFAYAFGPRPVSTAGSGYTLRLAMSSGTTEDKLAGAAGSYNATFNSLTTGDVIAVLAAFKSNITTSRNQTGLSRIGLQTPKTTTALSRIELVRPKTQNGVARVRNTTLKTQTGKLRLQVTAAGKTQTGVTRVRVSTTQTQTGVARVRVTTLKTQTAITRIEFINTKTQPGVTRVQATTNQIQAGKAKVQNTALQTTSAITRVQNSTIKTVTGVSTIKIVTPRPQTGLARIYNTTKQLQTALARVQITTDQTITGKSRIELIQTRTQPATIRIQATTVRDILAKGRIQVSDLKLQTALARMQVTTVKNQSAVARVRNTSTATQTAVGNIYGTTKRTQSGVASIRTTSQQDGRARIRVTVPQGQTAVARIRVTTLQTITGKARVQVTASLKTQTGVARIRVHSSRAQTGLVRVQNTTKHLQTGVAAIAQTNLHNGILGGSLVPNNFDPTFTSTGMNFNGLGQFVDCTIVPVSPLQQTVMIIAQCADLSQTQALVGCVDADKTKITGYSIIINSSGFITFHLQVCDSQNHVTVLECSPSEQIAQTEWFCAVLRDRGTGLEGILNNRSAAISQFIPFVRGAKNNSAGWIIGNQGFVPPPASASFWGTFLFGSTGWGMQNFSIPLPLPFFNGTVAYMCIWDRYLLDTELVEAYLFLKDSLAGTRGIILP